MPNSTRSAREEFLVKRIPGAQFLDLDIVASPHELGLKHMMPSNQVFANACGELLYYDRVRRIVNRAEYRGTWSLAHFTRHSVS